MIRKKGFPKHGVIMLVVLFLVCTGFLLLRVWEQNQNDFPMQEQGDTLIYNDAEYILNDRVETFLVLGMDQKQEVGTEGEYLPANLLMLLVIDAKSECVSLLPIRCDTMVDISVLGLNGNKVDSVTKQIAYAATYGRSEGIRCRNMMDAVSWLLRGVKVNHYISATGEALEIIRDFCESGKLSLPEGASLLKLLASVSSDCSATQLQKMAEKISSYEFFKIDMIEGKTVHGENGDAFYPDEDSVMETVIGLFYVPKGA